MDGLLENGCFKFNRWLSNTTFVESYNQTVRGICSIVRFIRSKDIYIYVYVCVCVYIYTPCLPRDTFRNLERTSIIGVKTRRYGTLTITRIARRMGNLFRRSRRAAKLTMNDHAN